MMTRCASGKTALATHEVFIAFGILSLLENVESTKSKLAEYYNVFFC